MDGKSVSDLIGEDVKVSKDGAVTGTLKHVSGWEWFNPSDESEQEGNYFPFKLGDDYSGKDVTVTREGGKTKTAQDTEWIVRVPDNDTVYTVKADEVSDLKLTFKNATLQKQ